MLSRSSISRVGAPVVALVLAGAWAAACSATGTTKNDDQSSSSGTSPSSGTTAAGASAGSTATAGAGGTSSGQAGSSQGGGAGEGASTSSSGTGGAGGGGGSGGTGGTCQPDPYQPADPTGPVKDFVVNGAPANAASKFGGPNDPAKAPTVVYPPDGTLLPPNVMLLEVQFLPASGTSLYEVRFASTKVDLRIYTPCVAIGKGCGLSLDAASWAELSSKNAGQGPVTLTVRGVDGSSPGAVGTSASRVLQIALEEMKGGVYYWAASPGYIMRYEFGVAPAKGEAYYTPKDAPGSLCVGCHALSSKGNRIAVGLTAPTQVSALVVASVATKLQSWLLGNPLVGGGSNFQAFSPDEKELITSDGGTLVLRNAADGKIVFNPLVPLGTMADYAPDNSAIVFAKPLVSPCMIPNTMCIPGISNGSIVLLPRNGNFWGAEQLLVKAKGNENNYYPAWSPLGDLILYNRSASAMSYMAADASLRVAAVSSGTPVPLAQANGSQGAHSWPKWAPHVQCHRGGKLLWLTFSSSRDYGLRIVNSELASEDQKWQVWMAAYDPTKGAADLDGSYPAFWLPFQDATTGNHIAQWVEKVIRKPCKTVADCAEFPPPVVCKNGFCMPGP